VNLGSSEHRDNTQLAVACVGELGTATMLPLLLEPVLLFVLLSLEDRRRISSNSESCEARNSSRRRRTAIAALARSQVIIARPRHATAWTFACHSPSGTFSAAEPRDAMWRDALPAPHRLPVSLLMKKLTEGAR